jgi:glutathione-specific gamma-glutamylcyclotransferase
MTPRKMDRDAIRKGAFIDIMREGERLGLFTIASESERRASLDQILKDRPKQGGIWVFGYGSLMWNPAMHVTDRRLGRVYGLHRCYRISSPIGRGMPEKPGLTLCLDQGGSASGMALHLNRKSEEEELSILWDREMITGAYNARWVTVVTEDGPLPAITFVANRDHPRYAGKQSDDEIVKILATAEGCLGSAHDYLKQTIGELEKLGWRATELHALEKRVSRYNQA